MMQQPNWWISVGQSSAAGTIDLVPQEDAPSGVRDASVSDILRSASNPDTSLGVPLGQSNSASPQEVPAGDARTTSDVPTNSDLPRSWDQMSWLAKAKMYVTDIIPGAIKDTFGMSGRPGAATVTSTVAGALPSSGTFILALILMVGGLFLVLLILRKV